MTPSPLDELIGLRLTSHVLGEDDVHLTFDDGAAVLSIYNPYEVREAEPGPLQTIDSVANRILSDVAIRPDVVELRFEEGWIVTIDLRDEAFAGPEAMQLRRPGHPIVVWN